ncbi:MAG: hypothetical protein C0524_08085 [Rhodobacter sp.]|nr:hypothetical protein [Rhodobacter sp.]
MTLQVKFTAEGIPGWFGPEPVEGSEPLDSSSIDGDLPTFLAQHRRVEGKWLPRLQAKPAEPSPEEIAARGEAEYLAALEQRDAALREALASEADPVFFKWQRDESDKADWLAAVAAVRARFPKPVPPSA